MTKVNSKIAKWQQNYETAIQQKTEKPVIMTRWSEVKEVLSDSSIRDIPEIANEHFVNNEIVNEEVVNNENVNKEIVMLKSSIK